jgi:hypothetical protein
MVELGLIYMMSLKDHLQYEKQKREKHRSRKAEKQKSRKSEKQESIEPGTQKKSKTCRETKK